MSTSRMIANRFGIGGPIGQGAMGEVYRGLDTQTNELVAIKALKQTAASNDPATVERFTREGEALRRLNHPNIVKVLASVIENDRHYIVMEYVGGGSLDKLLRRERQLALTRALEIAMDLADALVRAHRVKIIHRDIKPQNVLLAEDGTPRLTDFGVAHMSDMSTITQSGALVGTMPYLSPEAWQYDEPDSGTDIWAFGIMLYEMLAGRRPFDGDQPAQLKQAILRQPLPDLHLFRPDVPPALAELIGCMLEKDRTRRIRSMRLIGAELEAIARRAEQWPLEILLGQAVGAPTAPSVPAATPARTRATAVWPDLATLGELMKEKRRRLSICQRQAAKLGSTIDPSLVIEIADLENEIQDIGAQIKELEASSSEGEESSTDIRDFDTLFKQRRIDAALPSHANVGQRIDLIVQVRFPNSSALGIDDWPTRQKPATVEQGSEPVNLKFEIDHSTGAVKSTYLEFQVVAPDFTIENATRHRLEVPAREYSKRAIFLLTPLRSGNCRVNIEVYSLDSLYLGTIAIETLIGTEASRATATLATHVGTLTLTVAVGAQPNLDLSIDTTDTGYTVQLHSALTNAESLPQALVLPPHIAESGRRRDVADWVKQARIRRLRANEELRQARAFGAALFDQLFTGAVLEGFQASRAALPPGERLRLRLRLPPDLALIPWELLFDARAEQFLALAPDLTLLRSADTLAPVAPLHLDGPLQVVAVLASPVGADYPPIQLDRELRRIETVLKGPHAQNRVALDVIRGPGTLDQLRARLRTPVHVLHVLCHGDLDEARGGVLIFEDADSAPEPVGAELLRTLLQRRQPRLVLLNACLGALPGGEDPFSSVGAGLLAGGVPAVIAMQFELAEDTAVELARVFYAELAAGAPVDIALAEARLHLFGCYPTRLDWAIPVLFLRTDTGTLFATPLPLMRESAPPPMPVAALPPPAVAAPPPAIVEQRVLKRLWHLALTAYVTRDWERAAELLEQVADLKPDHEDVQARLAEARRQLVLPPLYRQALALRDDDHWQTALEVLAELERQQPHYPDAAGVRAWAELRARREQRYRAALAASAHGTWATAIAALEALLAELPEDVAAQGLLARASAEQRAATGRADQQATEQRSAAEQRPQRRWAAARDPRARYGPPLDDIERGEFATALDLLDELLTQQPADRAAAELVASLIERVDVPLQQRLRAATLAARVGDPRVGVDTLEPAWCAFPAGRYLIGAQRDPANQAMLTPQRVGLEAFQIARYPVTVGQFQRFWEDSAGYAQRQWWTGQGWAWKQEYGIVRPYRWGDRDWMARNQPVTGVSWYEAMAFCAWLTQRRRVMGLLHRRQLIRLPSEAEWEAAATGDLRAGQPRAWQPPVGVLWQNVVEARLGHAAPVGLFAAGASPCGALDMAGNVWEWCGSRYSDYPQAAARLPSDFAPSEDGPVLRGGAYNTPGALAGWGARTWYFASQHQQSSMGFRVVMVSKAFW